LCERGGEGREHEIPDSEGREACHGSCTISPFEHKQENLADVVVALEIAEIRLPP
jgi:hypothetical protein